MWEDQKDESMANKERTFQKMLVSNMESVFKIFFRNMTTTRIVTDNTNIGGQKYVKGIE